MERVRTKEQAEQNRREQTLRLEADRVLKAQGYRKNGQKVS